MHRVVVTGLGALTAIGNNIPEYAEGLKQGKSGSALITGFDTENFKTKFACEIKDFDSQAILGRKEARKVDLFVLYALETARQALEDSGIELDKANLDRCGVIYGSGIGGLRSLEREVSAHALGKGTPRYSPFMITQMISDMAAGMISMHYNLRGINYSVVSACATSTHALINSFDYLRLGKADMIVSGGAEATICQTGIGGFNAMRALSTRNEQPEAASRPFDANRDGFVMGEGGGCLVLETLEHAQARGAKIYAEIIGSGMTADAHHISAPAPDGNGARRAMELALEEAGLSTSEVDYINVHGTSTPLGDVAELKAIVDVFGDDAYDLNISSTKSMTGHLLGAAGAIEAIACILGMAEGFVPPTINHETADPEIDPRLNLTLNQAQHKDINVALSNTFGFGGHNTSIILKKWDE